MTLHRHFSLHECIYDLRYILFMKAVKWVAVVNLPMTSPFLCHQSVWFLGPQGPIAGDRMGETGASFFGGDVNSGDQGESKTSFVIERRVWAKGLMVQNACCKWLCHEGLLSLSLYLFKELICEWDLHVTAHLNDIDSPATLCVQFLHIWLCTGASGRSSLSVCTCVCVCVEGGSGGAYMVTGKTRCHCKTACYCV